MHDPLVSVIIPNYNNQKFIAASVQSALQQTYSPIEVIVVDDGSTDQSVDVLEGLLQKDTKKFTLLKQENSGVSAARNFGAKHATGNFYVFLDGDDMLSPEFVETCVSAYSKEPDLEIVYPASNYIGAKSGLWKLPDYDFSKFLLTNMIPVYGMVKANTFKAVAGFDESLTYYEDWDLWIRIIRDYPTKVKSIPQPLYQYRIHDVAKSSIGKLVESNQLLQNAYRKIYNKHYDLYIDHNLGVENLFYMTKYKQKYQNEWFRKFYYRLTKKTVN
ncbi:glycosyltransferase family 2 protein [Sphingobacterium hungaricum]|uniref:Glycosyltransferase 2-like domain-containing protein n=1 Tax=Sphingobacterium hungaricum TaxID=2082723 RepID=A0A928YPZ2_9SPHI|nr:glycosyltransferase family A protein [Sphingobacterium hungaricum]MBE8713681.1 hypothetical protein [Sphingobacterium hungaricum]